MKWGRPERREAATLIALLVLLAVGLVMVLAASANAGCRTDRCKYRAIKPHKPMLQKIRGCETRGLYGPARWRYNGSSGYDGAYQFLPSTWSSLGSRYAFAWQAPRVEQSYRAVVLAMRAGWGQWPVCSR